MAITVGHLLEGQAKLVTVALHDPVSVALARMIEHDYSQLPVVDAEYKPLGMVTSDAILRALNHFGVTLDALQVDDVLVRPPFFRAEEDIFELLDDVRDTAAVLIVDGEGKLVGLVTSYDTTEYFRRRAEDIMHVEDIESMMKEYITAAFTDPTGIVRQEQLDQAIQAIQPSDKELRKQFKQATHRYLELRGETTPKVEHNHLEQAFNDHLYQTPKQKAFDDLTLAEYTELLLHQSRWEFYKPVFRLDVAALRRLLKAVREARNQLAHFRGELSAHQREQIRFCKDWLTRHQPLPPIASAEVLTQQIDKPATSPSSPTYTTNPDELSIEVSLVDEEVSADDSRYARLALVLQSMPNETNFLTLKFSTIERITGGALPTYARQHRSWWANDSVSHPQSQQWLEVGWRVARVNLQQETVAFARIQEREQAYINFWSMLRNQLQASARVPLRNFVSHGESWITLANFPEQGSPVAFLGCSFARRGQFRVEVYIDSEEQDTNKHLFDTLYAHKADIEAAVGQSLSWERLDNRRASRIAAYTQGAITDSAEQLVQLRTWAYDTCEHVYYAFTPHIDQALRTFADAEVDVLLKEALTVENQTQQDINS